MRSDRLLLVVIALPLLLIGIGWGLPRATSGETVDPWGYDEIAPICPLTEAYYGFTRSGVKYLAYPLFHYVVLSISYAPYLAVEALQGHLHPSRSFPFGLDDPAATLAHLTLIARGVTVAMALGVVLTVYQIARSLFDRQSALWAAVLTAVLPTFTYYGRTSNLDVPYLFWTLLAVLAVARILTQGEQTRSYVLFGVFAALAVCTKDQAAGFLAPYPFILAAVGWRDAADRPLRKRLIHAVFRRPMLFSLAAGATTFTAANNLLFGWDGFVRHLQSAQEMAGDFRMFPANANGQLALAGHAGVLLAWTLGPGILWGLAGCVVLARQRNWAILAALALPPLTHHVLILARVGFAFPRFVLPAAVFMALLGAGGLHHATLGTRRFLRGVGLLSVAYALTLSVGIAHVLLHDARYTAETWIRDNVPRSSTFASNAQFRRLLPRVWDSYQLVSGTDPRRLSADYFLLLELTDSASDPDVPPDGQLDRSLPLADHQFVVGFDTPTLFPRSWVRIVNCTAPRVSIFRRSRPHPAPGAPSP